MAAVLVEKRWRYLLLFGVWWLQATSDVELVLTFIIPLVAVSESPAIMEAEVYDRV